MIGSCAPQTIRIGSRLGQVEAVRGRDLLAAGADHGAQGRQEGLAALGVGERGVAARHLGDVGARPHPDAAEPAADRASPRARPMPAVARDEEVGAGQRGGAQHGADLGAEAAAGDQHQALDHLRELVGELHRDPAAERVADQGRALVAEREQEVAQAGGEGAERVVAAAGSELPWPGRSGAITVWSRASGSSTWRPVLGAARHAVDREQRPGPAGPPR